MLVISRNNKTCLLMFSGGYDSLLAPCYLIEQGYDVLLVTFNNGLEKNLKTIEVNVERLTNLYGNKIQFLGIKNVAGLMRKFLIPYLTGRKEFKYNLKPMEIVCLSCRTAMYTRSIVECLLMDIKYIAEGARESQGYPEQQAPVIEALQGLCQRYSIELLLPVYNETKENEKEALIMRNIIPKTTEPYCTFQMPLYEYKPSKGTVNEMRRLLDEYLLPQAQESILKLSTLLKVQCGEEVLV